MKRFCIGVSLCLLLCICLTPAIAGKANDKPALDYWMGIYYGKEKIGYVHVSTGSTTYEGKPACILQDVYRIRYHDGDKWCVIDIVHNGIADANYNLLLDTLEFSLQNNSMAEIKTNSTGLKKTRSGYIMTVRVDSDSKQEPVKLTKEDVKNLNAGKKYEFGAAKLSPGFKLLMNRCYHRVLKNNDANKIGISMSSGNSTLSVLRREKLKLDNWEFDAIVVKEKGKLGEATRWQLENGVVLKEIASDGSTTFIYEPKAKATEIDSGNGPDVSQLQIEK